MTALATDWLALALLLSVAAWFAKRRIVAISLPIAVCIAAAAIWLPTGSPRFTSPPKGEYTVIGADIQVDIAIYALLKPKDGTAVYYRLSYSTQAANQLQQALDGAQGGGLGVKVKIDGEGGASYSGDPPVTGLPPKQVETPAVTLP